MLINGGVFKSNLSFFVCGKASVFTSLSTRNSEFGSWFLNRTHRGESHFYWSTWSSSNPPPLFLSTVCYLRFVLVSLNIQHIISATYFNLLIFFFCCSIWNLPPVEITTIQISLIQMQNKAREVFPVLRDSFCCFALPCANSIKELVHFFSFFLRPSQVEIYGSSLAGITSHLFTCKTICCGNLLFSGP